MAHYKPEPGQLWRSNDRRENGRRTPNRILRTIGVCGEKNGEPLWWCVNIKTGKKTIIRERAFGYIRASGFRLIEDDDEIRRVLADAEAQAE